MSNIVFVNNSNQSQSQEHCINTFIRFKDFTEYYQYKHKSMADIIDLMNSRRNDELEERLINNNVVKALDSASTQKIVEQAITKAIEESFKK